jgi:hypothetical protein
MKKNIVLTSLAFGLVLLAVDASAQPRRTQVPSGSQPVDVLPPPTEDTAQPAPAPGPSGPQSDSPAPAPDKKVVVPAAGYAYSDKPTGKAAAPRGTRYKASGPVVNMPGFEQTNEGGSRLFVQLSQNVQVEERKAQGSITYVLKGASPRVWNNTNALVTVHFNTPVSRARLVPQGGDLHFIIELRSAATPTWKMNDSQDKTAMLSVDFPKGDYLANGVAEPAGPAPRPAAAGPARGAARRRGSARPAAATPAPANNQPPVKIDDSNINNAKP